LTIGANGLISGSIRDLALSSDGRWLAAGGETQVRVWDLQTGRLYATLRGFQLPPGLKLGRVNSVAFSANAKQLVVGVSDNTDSGSMRIYDMDHPEEIAALLEGHTACSDRLAFSADFNYLASFG
jgi:WD40 repeat protein